MAAIGVYIISIIIVWYRYTTHNCKLMMHNYNWSLHIIIYIYYFGNYAYNNSLVMEYHKYFLVLSCSRPMLKVRGLSIKPRSSTICIDLSMHVHVVKD